MVELKQGEPVKASRKRWWLIPVVAVLGAAVTMGIIALLLNIAEKKQEANSPYFQVVQLTDTTVDPAVWGQNFPIQYAAFQRTAEMPDDEKVARTPTADDPREFTALSKLEADPRLVTMWQGYAFSVDYREPRGHAYTLNDQLYTRRMIEFKQPGACINCHASTVDLMNKLGNGDAMAGFAVMNKTPYKELATNPDAQHPVACIDCHDPKTMTLRVTRPAFIEGIKEYKASLGVADFDPNEDATPNEMRTYVCAQCHVEYYFKGEEKTLTFPWDKGLTVDDALAYYDEVGWSDFTHKLTGAKAVKAQHPDFETWSNGVHARSGVTCADCHMPYERVGAAKVSDHWVRSPMKENVNASCLTCHSETEDEMVARVEEIHDRYEHAKDVSFDALDQLIADIAAAQTNGVAADRLDTARAHQRTAQFFLDYVVSENSRGFHAPAYTIRILNDVTDQSRRGQLALLGHEMPTAPAATPAPSPTPSR